MYKPGQIFYNQLITQNISGVPTDADFSPWGTMVRNGIDDAAQKVFLTHIDVGRYTLSGLIPSVYAQNDTIGIISSGYVNGLFGKGYIDLGTLDVSDWTTVERNQIRFRIGLDGTSSIPANAKPAITTSITGSLPPVVLYSGGLDNIQIGGVNLRQALMFDTAVLAGVTSGTANMVWFNDINSNFARLSAIANSGIRTTINLVIS